MGSALTRTSGSKRTKTVAFSNSSNNLVGQSPTPAEHTNSPKASMLDLTSNGLTDPILKTLADATLKHSGCPIETETITVDKE